MVVALTTEGGVRERDFCKVTDNLSTCRPCERRDPYSAALQFRAVGVDTLCKQPTAVAMGPCVRRDDPTRARAPIKSGR
jgi:hypothetical protein